MLRAPAALAAAAALAARRGSLASAPAAAAAATAAAASPSLPLTGLLPSPPLGLPCARHQVRWQTSSEAEAVKTVNTFVKEALAGMDVDPGIEKAVLTPDRKISVALAVPRDDGEVALFHAHRVQHNNARGIYKGGLKYHPDADLADIEGLASLNSWKCALMSIPFGGSKGGIAVDPSQLSARELEKLTRWVVFDRRGGVEVGVGVGGGGGGGEVGTRGVGGGGGGTPPQKTPKKKKKHRAPPPRPPGARTQTTTRQHRKNSHLGPDPPPLPPPPLLRK
jgi:hypothetical protein